MSDDETLSAWKPGIRSVLPRAFMPMVSMFHPENMRISFEELNERADFTGLEREELAVFTPGRLALHSLLIRITANVEISDGRHYRDLGINFRSIAAELERTHLEPLMPQIERAYGTLRDDVLKITGDWLRSALDPAVGTETNHAPEKRGLFGLGAIFSRRHRAPTPQVPAAAPDLGNILADLAVTVDRAGDEKVERSLRSLHKLLTAISIRYGRIVGDPERLVEISTDMAMNVLGSAHLGELVEEGFHAAATGAGCRLLPAQSEPVVMNVKGASAAGKSTMRPLQHDLAVRLGLNWEDFALISPDIWRKYLLDYDGLGDAWRYAGTLSGQELKFVDRKLDLYMTMKGRKNQIPHMLIDRFRFDSFAEMDVNRGEHRLLTRFGHEIFMTFMVTPPQETVERAWRRGLSVQRFKAVDDLLDHNVEAYSGMPPLFFRWACRTDKRVHYEFLDNSVAQEMRPPTIAFGDRGELVILRIGGLIDIERFRKIRLDARSAEDLYPPDGEMAASANTTFLRQCAERLVRLRFADPVTGKVFATREGGRLTVLDAGLFDHALEDGNFWAGMEAIDKTAVDGGYSLCVRDEWLDEKGTRTMGQWGSRPAFRQAGDAGAQE